MSQVLEYLQGTGADHQGRMLIEVLAADDAFLEQEHDYIQWLFPLREPSYNVESAPIITEIEIGEAYIDKRVQKNMNKSLGRMTKFYLDNDHWLQSREHNHLRITRIIKSVRMILGEEKAEMFYNNIMERINSSGVEILPLHLAYWTDAIGLSFDKPIDIIRAS